MVTLINLGKTIDLDGDKHHDQQSTLSFNEL